MIDKVIIISLPERKKDRLDVLCEYLDNECVEYEVFNAIGKENGAEGLIESVRCVYELCLSSDAENFLILEDDAHFIIDKPFEFAEKCMMQLPLDYDLFLLGCNLFQTNIELYTPNLIQVLGAWALHACVYSRKGIRKSLKAIEERDNGFPLDTLLVERVQIDGKSFCAFPMACTQRNGLSNIAGREVNYERFLIHRFNERTKHIA